LYFINKRDAANWNTAFEFISVKCASPLSATFYTLIWHWSAQCFI